VFHVTYGWYSGRYNDTQVGSNSAVGNPALTIGVYNGPEGQGREFAPGFDPANYDIVFGSFPTANVFMESGLSSPVTKEFTASAGTRLGANGSAQVTYVMRHMDNFIEDFIDIANGTTHVVQNGTDFGTFTNIQYRNSNVPKRDYQAMVFQADYRLKPTWQIAGSYTLQFVNDGTFEGEAQNQPGISSFAFTILHSAHRERSVEGHLTYSHMRMYKEGVPRASTTSDPFNAVAEPRRRDILEFLAAEERSVSEIVDALELAQPSVSKHLNVLRNVRLVTARRDGKRMFYRTNAETLRTIHDWSGMFAQHWRGQLKRIKAHAEGKR